MRQCDLSALKRKWSSEIVARREVAAFTGGMISPGTLANFDSKKEGPEGAFRIGRNVGYPVDSFIKWLESRIAHKSDMSKVRAAKDENTRRERKRRKQ